MCTTQGYMEMQPGKSVPTPDRSNKRTGRQVVYQTSGYDAHDCWCVKNRTFSPQAASYFFLYFSICFRSHFYDSIFWHRSINNFKDCEVSGFKLVPRYSKD